MTDEKNTYYIYKLYSEVNNKYLFLYFPERNDNINLIIAKEYLKFSNYQKEKENKRKIKFEIFNLFEDSELNNIKYDLFMTLDTEIKKITSKKQVEKKIYNIINDLENKNLCANEKIIKNCEKKYKYNDNHKKNMHNYYLKNKDVIKEKVKKFNYSHVEEVRETKRKYAKVFYEKMKLINEDKIIHCKLCNKNIKEMYFYKVHIKDIHKEYIKNKDEEYFKNENITDEDKNNRFYDLMSEYYDECKKIDIHNFDECKIKCKHCDKIFFKKYTKSHIKNNHIEIINEKLNIILKDKNENEKIEQSHIIKKIIEILQDEIIKFNEEEKNKKLLSNNNE